MKYVEIYVVQKTVKIYWNKELGELIDKYQEKPH